MRRFLAGLVWVVAFTVPALGADAVALRPAHPVAGYRCWLESVPGGAERICEEVAK